MLLALPFKINVPKTETTLNPKSASFVVIMLSHKGFTHIQSQIEPWLLFGESFTLIGNLNLFWHWTRTVKLYKCITELA